MVLLRLPLREVDTLSSIWQAFISFYAGDSLITTYQSRNAEWKEFARLELCENESKQCKKEHRIKLHRRAIRLAGSQANSWFRCKSHWNTREHGRWGIGPGPPDIMFNGLIKKFSIKNHTIAWMHAYGAFLYVPKSFDNIKLSNFEIGNAKRYIDWSR